MAVPLIVSIVPATGPTGGRSLVEIRANNLRTAPDAPSTGLTDGILQQTVEVLFGTEPATAVKVYSQGRLTCLAPGNDPGATDVTVSNLDDLGVVIPGETVTRTDGYEYQRPDLLVESDFTRLIRTLIRQLKREIVAEVSLTTHTDFDDETEDALNIVGIASLPGLILIGPEVVENRFFSTNQREEIDNGDGTFSIRRVPYTVDVQFEIVGVADRTTQMANLLAATIQFMNRHKTFSMDRDPDDLNAGQIAYEMDFASPGGEPSTTSRLNNSNVRSFSGTLVIRGFNIEDLAGVTNDMLIGESTEVGETGIVIESENLTEHLIIGRHPGEGC